jgi:hypothetical protein
VPTSGTPPHNIAIRGLDFNPGNLAGVGFLFNGMGYGILIEGNILRYTSVSYNSTEAQSVLPTLQTLIFRNNTSYGVWSTGGPIGSFYCSGIDGVTVEDNVFYHIGWKIGASRDDVAASGGPTVFNHPIYLQCNTNGTVRRNLTMDSADTSTARGNINWYDNVSIRDPSGVGLGDSTEYNVDRPAGIDIAAWNNLFVAAIDLNSTNPRGYAFTTANGKSGSRVHHNLMIRSTIPTGVNAKAFNATTFFNQPSYIAFEDNYSYVWNPSGQTYYSGGGFYPAQAFTTYARNGWEDPSSGTNFNNSADVLPNAYTEAQLYAALTATYASITDYASLVSYAIANPEAHVQRAIQSLAYTGYGRTLV